MKFSIQDINKKLEALFEGKLVSVFNKNPLILMTEKLIESIELEHQEKDENIYIPNIISIKVKEKTQFDLEELKEWENFALRLIEEISEKNSYIVAGPLKIEILFDDTIEELVQISAHQTYLASGDTISLPVEETNPNKSEVLAYLILWDEEYFTINKNIVNIGRHEQNDLAIDNLRVSRFHAQIRRINQDFYIVDTNSTSGTKVNGQIIEKHLLLNGDVVEIADVPIIFSRDEMPNNFNRTKLLTINEKKKNL
jgi:pSer/pThr/pTyr-binding forkhead associated (FHA) protein